MLQVAIMREMQARVSSAELWRMRMRGMPWRNFDRQMKGEEISSSALVSVHLMPSRGTQKTTGHFAFLVHEPLPTCLLG